MVGNDSMYFKACSTLWEPLSLHCAVARSGGLALTLIHFPLNTNSRGGVLIALDEEAMKVMIFFYKTGLVASRKVK